MPDTEICEYTFDPDEWDEENRSDSSVEYEWDCPHPTHVDTEYCMFHLEPERRELLGITPVDLRDRLLRVIQEADEDKERRFVGAEFGELDLEGQKLCEEGNILDLRHTEIGGKVDLSGATIDCELLWECSDLQAFESPNADFEGDVSFRASDFGGEVNFDGSRFHGDVDMTQVDFDLKAEFSDAVFEGDSDFGYTTYKGIDNTFSGAVFEGSAGFGGIKIKEANFTSATFERDADFSNARFDEETLVQYITFRGPVTFEGADFTDNTKFRGTEFGGNADFEDVTFRGWVTFLNVEFGSDADFTDAWFKRDLNLVVESDTNVKLRFEGARVSQGTFEFDSYNPVFVDMTKARVGDVSLTTEQGDRNPLNHVRFVETEFSGFDFGAHADHLRDADHEIHTTTVHDDDVELARLEKTYRLASDGAKGRDDGIASTFAKKESAYRRQRGEGGSMGALADLVRDYGVYAVGLLVIIGAGVAAFVLDLVPV